MSGWRNIWSQSFPDEPSADTAKAMDSMVRLCSPNLDDPMIVMTMYLQYQNQLIHAHGGRIVTYAGELERVSAAIRDASDDVRDSSSASLESVKNLQNDVAAACEDITSLRATTTALHEDTLEAVGELDHARKSLEANRSFWRLDLAVIFGSILAASVGANVILAATMLSRPPLSVEMAASQLASVEDAPRLIELQRSGDLQMVLRCEGTNWRKTDGYCRPVAGKYGIQGWHTIPSRAPDIIR